MKRSIKMEETLEAIEAVLRMPKGNNGRIVACVLSVAKITPAPKRRCGRLICLERMGT